LMKGETKAKRRAIRALSGFGAPDEDEAKLQAAQGNKGLIDDYEKNVRQGPSVEQNPIDGEVVVDETYPPGETVHEVEKDPVPEATEQNSEEEDAFKTKQSEAYDLLMEKFDNDIEKATAWVTKLVDEKFHLLTIDQLDKVIDRLKNPHPGGNGKPATPMSKDFNTIGMGDVNDRRKLAVDALAGFYMKHPDKMHSSDPHKKPDPKNYPMEIIKDFMNCPLHAITTNRDCNRLDGLVESIIKGKDDYNDLIESGRST